MLRSVISQEAGNNSVPSSRAALAFAALGIVYGDIGTSPLYAIKESFHIGHDLAVNTQNVLGILSLMFWSLLLIVVVKYLTFVLRADNRGEGGVLSLIALLAPKGKDPKFSLQSRMIIMLGVIGAALLVADSTITPAISVLSAVEGVLLRAPQLHLLVPPIAIGIIVSIFLLQSRGTAKIGRMFAPFMVLWFATIALLGLRAIWQYPNILRAVDPWWAFRFFRDNGWDGFTVLGSVVLCITGAEALYADMGHFGKDAIRLAWLRLVFPALLLNYFGQGALIVNLGQAGVINPFYELAPSWFLYPLVAIATCAAVIASQAMISGTFSLAQQAVQLGFSPRLTIVHTSGETKGQIYIPEINYLLMFTCVGIILLFKNSSNLAVAYGIAVVGAMTITSVLLFFLARRRWKWGQWTALAFLLFCLAIDIPFLVANLQKIADGAWVTLAIAAAVFATMTTWKAGRKALAQRMRDDFVPLQDFLAEIKADSPRRVPGTAVFMTSNLSVVPPTLLHNFAHNKVLHETVLILSVVTDDVPEVPDAERVDVQNLGIGIQEVQAHYGFMQTPNVIQILRAVERSTGVSFVQENVTYFLGRESLLTTGHAKMMWWRKVLFAFLTRNARPATAYFGIPPDRVVELGMQVEL